MQIHSDGLPDLVQLGNIAGARHEYYFVDTALPGPAAVAAVADLHRRHRLHFFFGPWGNRNALALQQWLVDNIPSNVRGADVADF